MNSVGDHLATAVAVLPAPSPSASSGKASARAPEGKAEPVAAPRIKIQSPSQDVRFMLDGEGKPIAVVVDALSGDVIRQIPSEETLALRRQLGHLQGVMLREKA